MPRKKLRAKRTIPEHLKENINIQLYLTQYKLTDIPNPSDDSDFEDTSYETDLLYEKERRIKLQQEAKEQEEINTERERNAKEYFERNKNNPDSIFNVEGMNFKHYDHNFISFVFYPSVFSNKFMCEHRKYHVSLKFGKSWWHLKRFHVPNKDEMLRIFYKYFVTDDDLSYILFKIYYSLVQCTHDQINMRKEKYEKFLSHEEVELNSDDEILFLTPEERKKRKAEIMKVWKRMLPPDCESRDDESF